MKPGWQTTEFWAAVAAKLIALLVALGAISSGDAAGLGDGIGKGIAGAGAAIAAAVTVWKYIHHRTELKLAHLDAQDGQPAGPANGVIRSCDPDHPEDCPF